MGETHPIRARLTKRQRLHALISAVCPRRVGPAEFIVGRLNLYAPSKVQIPLQGTHR